MLLHMFWWTSMSHAATLRVINCGKDMAVAGLNGAGTAASEPGERKKKNPVDGTIT